MRYVLGSAIVALAMAYWPASSGDMLAKFNLLPGHLASAVDLPNRAHKSDPLGISFEQRWIAVPPAAAQGRGKPQTDTRMEKIPFSCELAFSRIISKGNFSTRCIAAIGTDARSTAAG